MLEWFQDELKGGEQFITGKQYSGQYVTLGERESSIDMWMMLLLVVMSISMHRLNAIDLALESSLMIENLPC